MTNRVVSSSRTGLKRSTESCWKLVYRLPVIALILIVGAAYVLPAVAQTTTGTISGTVVDPGGALIPGAMVSATNEATGESRNTLSSETGTFSFPSLLPATYTIRVELAGFQTFQKTGNILTPNSRLDVGELKLTIGGVGETINVEASVARCGYAFRFTVMQ